MSLLPWYIKYGVIAAVVMGLLAWVYHKGGEADRIRADNLTVQLAQSEKLREEVVKQYEERAKQVAAQAELETKAWKTKDEANQQGTTKLLATIDSLRNRPDRPAVPRPSAAAQARPGSEPGAAGTGLPGAHEPVPERPIAADAGTAADATSGPAAVWSTGANLWLPDAEWLAGEAARANRLRAALSECYSVMFDTPGATP